MVEVQKQPPEALAVSKLHIVANNFHHHHATLKQQQQQAPRSKLNQCKSSSSMVDYQLASLENRTGSNQQQQQPEARCQSPGTGSENTCAIVKEQETINLIGLPATTTPNRKQLQQQSQVSSKTQQNRCQLEELRQVSNEATKTKTTTTTTTSIKASRRQHTKADTSALMRNKLATSGGNICAGCSRPIREQYLLEALDKRWHEDCLKCACCECRLGEVGSSLFLHLDKIFCRRDFLRIFGQRGQCALCSKSIEPYELVMRAKGHAFHIECFACQQCQARFCVGDQFCLWPPNKIVCLDCHQAATTNNNNNLLEHEEPAASMQHHELKQQPELRLPAYGVESKASSMIQQATGPVNQQDLNNPAPPFHLTHHTDGQPQTTTTTTTTDTPTKASMNGKSQSSLVDTSSQVSPFLVYDQSNRTH